LYKEIPETSASVTTDGSVASAGVKKTKENFYPHGACVDITPEQISSISFHQIWYGNQKPTVFPARGAAHSAPLRGNGTVEINVVLDTTLTLYVSSIEKENGLLVGGNCSDIRAKHGRRPLEQLARFRTMTNQNEHSEPQYPLEWFSVHVILTTLKRPEPEDH
jgi:hypothetical protein